MEVAGGSILILLALLVEGSLLFWQISSPLRIHLVPPRGSPAGSVTSSPSALGSLAVSTQVDFTCTLPMTVYPRRILVSLPSGSIRFNDPQPPNTGGPNNTTYIQKRWLLCHARGCHQTARLTPQWLARRTEPASTPSSWRGSMGHVESCGQAQANP
jgi:hypothetical protein